jgi:tRNA-modifying protein YgfZ
VSAGFLALPERRVVEVAGADRMGYLQRMLTQDVARLPAGHGAPACYLTATGRVLAHMLVWRLPEAAGERLLLDVAQGASPEALPLLERYVIADDVTFTDVSATWGRFLVVRGAGGASAAPQGTVAALDVPGVRAWSLALPFGTRRAEHVLCVAADAERVRGALAAAAAAWNGDDLARARVEEGVAWPGVEIDERILPNEARLDDAVATDKGCYPGQEPVVMARHRGRPPTLLVRLALDGASTAARDAALTQGPRAVGRLTTVAGDRALGFVRSALSTVGTVLDVAGGGRATVAGAAGP